MSSQNFNSVLQSLLRSALTSSQIRGAFEAFLDAHINIPIGTRSGAGTSQRNIREFLQGESRRDETFPRILQKSDTDFMSGSFARHTKTWPLDDIDLLFPLDGGGLYYWREGILTPNTVVSDGGVTFNPLLGRRWAVNNRISSNLLVKGFEEILQRRYSQSDVAIDGEAVSVQLTIGASEQSDGLKFDVVPCFRLDPHDGSDSFYLIPDGHHGWKHTNPRLDEALCAGLHEFHGRVYRKIVKLVKYWNAYQLNNAFSSYYMELSIANFFSTLRSSGRRITTISEGVALAFSALSASRNAGDIPSPVQHAPVVQLGLLRATDDQKLANAYSSSAAAVPYERAGHAERAMSEWKNVFGSNFGS
jgi:hypothetical protein